MSTAYSETVATARDYYNSEDADNFYNIIWGGEDIHIGLYESDSEAIVEASHRTVRHMAAMLTLNENSKVLDIGAGYGGAARYLAETFGCSVIALNLSEKENQRNRELNTERGLSDRIEVVDGSFESIPTDDNSFDVVWSQDAILHSGKRGHVVKEVSRVLKPGGHFIFTDPMQADNCPAGVLQPILDRIHLSSLSSPAFYRQAASENRLKELRFEDHTHQLIRHYTRVLQETEIYQNDLVKIITPEYIERMKKGLQYWIDGGNNDYLAWGIFIFEKE